MPLPLANLDDRRWTDLVEEGRALLPLFARLEPRWTDHNLHDPGITLLELFAWLAEMDVYRLSRIPERHRRKFLALIGFSPRLPTAARTVLRFKLKDGATPVSLPAGVEFETPPLPGLDPRFRTLSDLTVVPLTLGAILVDDGRAIRDRTREFGEDRPGAVFGEDPHPDPEKNSPALYLGLREPLPSGVPVSLFLHFSGAGSAEDARQRLLQEALQARQACQPPPSAPCEAGLPQDESCLEGEGAGDIPRPEPEDSLPPHHSARLVWEIYVSDPGQAGGGRWLPAGEVEDDTRSLTLDGSVRITLPGSLQPSKSRQGPLREEFYYLRCRMLSGQYDAPPRLLAILPNAVPAEQAVPVGQWRLDIPAGVLPEGPAPQPGSAARIRLSLDAQDAINGLAFEPEAEELPEINVLEYAESTPYQPGKLVLEIEVLGRGREQPGQVFNLSEVKVQSGSLRLFTLEKVEAGAGETAWREWLPRQDLDSSTRTDSHFILDAETGEITAGTGEQGRLFPRGVLVLAAYRSTQAGDGNLAPGKVTDLASTAHNRALLADFAGVRAALERITNSLAASGGADAESSEQATGRAMEDLWAHERLIDLCERFACSSLDQIPREEILAVQAPQRAVALVDFERLALDTPGTQVARARAWANLHPAYPCLKAPGVVTVVILPSLPARRPQPGSGLLAAVRRYLNRRRTITTRVEVVGPTYLEVSVRAKVQALAGASPDRVRRDVLLALDSFLEPRSSGEKPGWPFGRDIYRAEILQAIDGVAGVDHVSSLELVPGDGEPQCGNLRLCPTWLPVPGKHEIEVMRG